MDAPAVGVNAEAEMGTLEIDAQLCRPSRFAAVVAGEAVRFASPIARAEDPSQQTPEVSDTAGPHPELAGDTNEPDFATRLELFIKFKRRFVPLWSRQFLLAHQARLMPARISKRPVQPLHCPLVVDASQARNYHMCRWPSVVRAS